MSDIFVFKVLSERWFSNFPDLQNGDWRVTEEFSQVCFWTGESILMGQALWTQSAKGTAFN